MESLRDLIKKRKKRGGAIGHFNFADLTVLKAATLVSSKLKTPIIIGTSEGERQFLDQKLAVILVKWLRQEAGAPIFINADHTHSFLSVKEAVAAGYDAILFDGSSLSLEKNIKETKKVVEYIKSKNPSILVEGEIGYIGSSSSVFTDIPKGAAVGKDQLTKVAEAVLFVKETGVDLLAPAVGNIHGIVKNYRPRLDLIRIKQIKEAVGIPLVLHGGSGLGNKAIKEAVIAGMDIVHISTEIRVAWRSALEQALMNKDELAPYRILDKPMRAAAKVIERIVKSLN